jgi:hypothetical protein
LVPKIGFLLISKNPKPQSKLVILGGRGRRGYSEILGTFKFGIFLKISFLEKKFGTQK